MFLIYPFAFNCVYSSYQVVLILLLSLCTYNYCCMYKVYIFISSLNELYCSSWSKCNGWVWFEWDKMFWVLAWHHAILSLVWSNCSYLMLTILNFKLLIFIQMRLLHHLEKHAPQTSNNMQIKASPMLRCHGIHPYLKTMMDRYHNYLSAPTVLHHKTHLLRVNTEWHIQQWIKQRIKLIAHSTSKWKVQYFWFLFRSIWQSNGSGQQ